MSESMCEKVPDTDAPSLCPKGGYQHQASTSTTQTPPRYPRPLQIHQAASVNPCPIYAPCHALLFICNIGAVYENLYSSADVYMICLACA
jgi:hypothetical protein